MVGVVHLRDLVVHDDGVAGDYAKPAVVMPDSLRVSEALRQLKAERRTLAVVVDERGAVDGIVTLEDLLEEVVGEIYDETDRDVLSVLGHIPTTPGETVTVDGWTFEVRRIEGHAITKLRLQSTEAAPALTS